MRAMTETLAQICTWRFGVCEISSFSCYFGRNDGFPESMAVSLRLVPSYISRFRRFQILPFFPQKAVDFAKMQNRNECWVLVVGIAGSSMRMKCYRGEYVLGEEKDVGMSPKHLQLAVSL